MRTYLLIRLSALVLRYLQRIRPTKLLLNAGYFERTTLRWSIWLSLERVKQRRLYPTAGARDRTVHSVRDQGRLGGAAGRPQDDGLSAAARGARVGSATHRTFLSLVANLAGYCELCKTLLRDLDLRNGECWSRSRSMIIVAIGRLE